MREVMEGERSEREESDGEGGVMEGEGSDGG